MAGSFEWNNARESLKRFAQGFTPGQKAVTIAAVAVVVLGTYIFSRIESQPTYAPLFSNLQPQDAAQITSKLASAKVPYQLADGGSTILVPASEVDQERLAMAEAGLPTQGNVGLSLLDKEGITTSQFTQQADYQQAIQGELQQTIEAIQGVNNAQVEVVMPPQNYFSLAPPSPASASVMVSLDPGVQLTTEQVQAIVHLVASAVPNLSASNVTVVDQNGDVLAAPGVNESATMLQSQAETYDQQVAASIENMLDQLVGPGNAVAVVHATFDNNQVSSTSQLIQTGPGGKPLAVPTSSQTSKETYSGTGQPQGGILGTAPTTPSLVGGKATYSTSSSHVTYDYGKITTTTKTAPGRVVAMSVAVLVNSQATTISPAKIRSLVAAAAGVAPSPSNLISVVEAPFSNQAQEEAKQAARQAAAQAAHQSLLNLIKTGALGLAVLVALLILWRSGRRERRTEVLIAPSEPLALPSPPLQRELEAPNRAEEVEALIDEQPEEVAALLRSWMAERSGAGR